MTLTVSARFAEIVRILPLCKQFCLELKINASGHGYGRPLRTYLDCLRTRERDPGNRFWFVKSANLVTWNDFTQLTAISIGDATLLDVVKSLGEYLTAEEDELRNKGMLVAK
jgi:hypothetical protein